MSINSFTLFQIGNRFCPKVDTVLHHSGNHKEKHDSHEQMLQHQKQRNIIETMPYNSYSHNHGIVTASALLELRPTLQW
jgi:hypothetical protein